MPKRALWIAASLVTVVLLVGFIFAIVNKGSSSINNTMKQYDSKMSQYDDMTYSILGSSTSGNEIIGMIQSMKNDGVTIVVVNGNGGSGQTYTYDKINTESTGATLLKNIQDPTKTEYYINPTATFESSIERDVNDIITKVTFKQVK